MHILRLLPILAAVGATSACAPLKPWVKPYEREHLAARVMKWDRDPVSAAYLTQVRECREGARGGAGTTSLGCSSN